MTPFALNKSRFVLSQSEFNSFLPTIRAKQFSDLKGLTLLWKKIDNEIEHVFLYDTGNNLNSLSSNISNSSSTTIIAEKGIVEDKELYLINGQIISNKKSSNESDVIQFDELNIDLKMLDTTVIKKPKLQETSTLKLLSCVFNKNILDKLCNNETMKEIIPALIRRLILPAYIPILALFASILLLNSKNYFSHTFSIFFIVFLF